MAKTGVAANRGRRYIRITDENLWDMIDRLSAMDESFSFNEIINQALRYGLPEMIKAFKGEVDLQPADITKEYSEKELEQRKYYRQIVTLMREINLNSIICKLILSQLCNTQILEAKRKGLNVEKLEQGAFCDTPEFLEDYEISELKKIRES